MREFEIYIDGASKGNPGPAGVGVVICQDWQVVKNIYSFIGEATNNVAEYSALIEGLKECLRLKACNIKINSDSQLLCHQLNLIYKIKAPHILKLYLEARSLMKNFKKVIVEHIPREKNTGADKLANKAIKEAAVLSNR